ncbi:MAG: fasciclin [Sphingomonas bacterium]|uniref:fasciclin domain-containing protein n=1 Tax=Sphingomonas bacterium TaxID=1895847 RepID=UPI0026106337|nr:fasciclin domain-containing protein [Sphingomonas bacterium]MDB5696678.1 fasciclin [Sphingomonas bacterium]
MRALPLVLLLLASCAPTARGVRVAPDVAVGSAGSGSPASNPPVGGVAMPANRSLAVNVAAPPNLATFARALTAGGVADTLAGPGPFTLFAPTDEAFARLAPGTVQALLKPENRASLTALLRLHLVTGRVTSAELIRRVRAGGGRASLTSVAGEPIAVSTTGGIVTLTDRGGNKSYVETADVRHSNGTMHVVNGVLLPRI